METINYRIKKIREKYDVGNKDFADMVGEKPNTVNNWVREGYSIGISVILKISDKFKDIDLNWLLKGEGDMLKSNNQNIGDISNSHLSSNIMNTSGNVVNIPNFNGEKIISPDGKVELCGDAQSTIEKLEIENKHLNQRIADLNFIINMQKEVIFGLKKELKVNNPEAKE